METGENKKVSRPGVYPSGDTNLLVSSTIMDEKGKFTSVKNTGTSSVPVIGDDGSFANGMTTGDALIKLVSTQASSGVLSPDFIRMITQLAALRTVELQRVQDVHTEITSEEESVTLSSIPDSTPPPSRCSRRAIRRQKYLERCAVAHRENGYCYLLMIKLPKRLSIKAQIGPRPDLKKMLSLDVDCYDVDNLKQVGYLWMSTDLIHITENVIDGSSVWGLLRRTLALFPNVASGLREAIGEDTSYGDIINAVCVLGGTTASVQVDEKRNPIDFMSSVLAVGERDTVDTRRISMDVDEELLLSTDGQTLDLCHYEFDTPVEIKVASGSHIAFGDAASVLIDADVELLVTGRVPIVITSSLSMSAKDCMSRTNVWSDWAASVQGARAVSRAMNYKHFYIFDNAVDVRGKVFTLGTDRSVVYGK